SVRSHRGSRAKRQSERQDHGASEGNLSASRSRNTTVSGQGRAGESAARIFPRCHSDGNDRARLAACHDGSSVGDHRSGRQAVRMGRRSDREYRSAEGGRDHALRPCRRHNSQGVARRRGGGYGGRERLVSRAKGETALHLVMRRTFNLAEWAICHRSFVTFIMVVLLAAGAWSYVRLGRSEDPPFTVKEMIVQAQWPGATISDNLQQVTAINDNKLQAKPHLDNL